MNFGDRWDSHRACLRGGYHGNTYLQRSWNKYGEENFEFVILHELQENEDIDLLEMHYISIFKEKGLAYNFHQGGNGGMWLGKHLSEETKRKIGEKNRLHMTGRKASESTRRKMASSQRARWGSPDSEMRKKWGEMISSAASGYHWSPESRKKFAEIQKTRPNGSQYELDTIKEIRRLHEEEGKGYTGISKIMQMPRGTVYNIATYRRWANA